MSDVMSQIGQFLGSPGGKAAETGAVAGGGFLQNFMANREAQKKQKFVENLIQNPQKFNQFVSGFEKPLTAGLTADVARQTDAYGAERGLGSSPVVMQNAFAQGLAPLMAQQQNQATQDALKALGIYSDSPSTKPVDVSSLLKALMMQKSTPPSGGPVVDPGVDVRQPSYVPGQGPTDPIPFDPTTALPQPTVAGGDSSGLFG